MFKHIAWARPIGYKHPESYWERGEFQRGRMLPDYPPVFWLCAVLVVVLIGISKAGFGAGVGVIATPLMALTIPTAEAVGLMLPLLILSDFMAIHRYRARYDRRNLRIMLSGALVGIFLGWLFFGYFLGNERILKFGIGLLAVAFVAFQAGRAMWFKAIEGRKPKLAEGLFWSVLSGFIGTLAHVGSPPVMVYLLPQKLPRDIFVGTIIYYFTIVNLIKLVPYAQLGLIRIGNLTTILMLLPVAYVGVKLGAWLNRHCSDRWFNLLVYGLLLLTGLQLIFGFDVSRLFNPGS